MNPARHLRPVWFLLLAAAGLLLYPLLRAEDTPPPAPTVAAEAPPAAPATPAAPAAVAPAEESKNPAPAAEATESDDAAEVAPAAAPEAPEKPAAPKKAKGKRHRHEGGVDNQRVSIWGNSTLEEGQESEAVVSIVGSSSSAGKVAGAVVSIAGGSKVTGGEVQDAVVSIFGNTYVNAPVHGEVVTVLGNIEFGPKAVVDGEVVCVGGTITRDPAAVLHGHVQNVAFGGKHFNFGGVATWFQECLFYARPLAFHPQLVWAWGIAAAFLIFYLLVALVAPAGVNKCVDTLEQHPGSSVLAAVLALLLTPVAYLLLVVTIALAIGLVLIPLFSTGLFLAGIFGKVVMLAWLGRRLTRLVGGGALSHPVFGVMVGGVLVMLLYTIPVFGFILYKLLGFLGLGVVIYTLILQFKASRAARPAPAPRVVPAVGAVAGVPGEPPPVSPVGMAPTVVSAATLPRAGFWIRIGASFLDFMLLAIVSGMSSSLLHGWFSPGGSLPFWFAVYCTMMWATRGTTIGGIICGLKVVRLDDRPLDWGVAVVRALGGFLSLAVAGLGFVWVAFDDDRQSWHDKIAGTTIVRVPKGTALL